MVNWIIGKDENVISAALKALLKHIDIFLLIGNVCKQKGSPRVHCVIGRLLEKIKDLNCGV